MPPDASPTTATRGGTAATLDDILGSRVGPRNKVGPTANSTPASASGPNGQGSQHDLATTPRTVPGLGSTDPNMDPPAKRPDTPARTPEQQRARAVQVRELFYTAREARRDVMAQWKVNYRSLNNKDYRPSRNAWDEQPAVSSVWPVIASAVAWMTDQRPITEVTPVSEPNSPYWDFYQRLARDMNVCLSSLFANHGLDSEITKILWDTYSYGIGYTKTQWEAHLADGLGDMSFRRVDPFTIYPDPHAKNLNEVAYIIEARTMTVADVDRAWPGAARLIGETPTVDPVASAPDKLDGHTNPNQPRPALGALAPATRSQGHNPVSHPSRSNPDEPVVTVLEAYIRTHDASDTDSEGVARVTDSWQCVVVVGEHILMDMPCTEMSPFPTHPYDRCLLFDTGEFYGPCIVEFLTPIQRVINWLLGAMARNIYLMGNPVLVEDPHSATWNKRFTNRPGQRLQGKPGSVKWMDPPQIQPQIAMQLVEYYESKIETISGLSAMVRGFSPTGRNSQGVLDSVQDAAFVRVRASLRELEHLLQGVAVKLSSGIAEFYSEPRLMSIIGPDGQDTHLSLKSRHFYTVDLDNPSERVPLRFTLNADAGSQLPTSKQARSAEAKHLFTLGAIDVYELLKTLEWPQYALVTQRVMQQQAEAAATDTPSAKA